ncbi:Alpha/Beta hydrolase protein [Thelonectria olida]|uniref:Alpha/Beta hydrolase protein n=1 Tax=Thelonectria olida TaxID=1576542 RepID=A0A9P9AEQ1_9HYPO|nr:Alpha/Beta hydrolase protein [Thelonectria olida]
MAFPLDETAKWKELGGLDPELEQVWKSSAPTDIATIAATRDPWKALYKANADKAVEEANGRVEKGEILIPRRDGGTSRALVYKPSDPDTEPRPLLVLIHGGGFCFGSPEMEGGTCVSAVDRFGCVSQLVLPFGSREQVSTASEDCWDALVWITKYASKLGADLSKGFVLGGTSAGGNIAIVLSHLARDEGMSPPLTGLYLNVPLVLAPEAVPQGHRVHEHEYRSYAADVGSPIWSPFNWPGSKPHSGLPRTYFQICGLDVLRDEGLMYERVLRKDYGIPTKVDLYPGLPHMFVPNFPEHSATKKYPADTSRGIGWLFGVLTD